MIQQIEVRDGQFPQPILETTAHHPQGTLVLVETGAGPIYRMPVLASGQEVLTEIPSGILANATTSNRTRDRITRMLSFNSKTGLPEIGRPNSAFLHKVGGELVVDHLLEDEDHERDKTPKLHDIIREHIDYF